MAIRKITSQTISFSTRLVQRNGKFEEINKVRYINRDAKGRIVSSMVTTTLSAEEFESLSSNYYRQKITPAKTVQAINDIVNASRDGRYSAIRPTFLNTLIDRYPIRGELRNKIFGMIDNMSDAQFHRYRMKYPDDISEGFESYRDRERNIISMSVQTAESKVRKIIKHMEEFV